MTQTPRAAEPPPAARGPSVRVVLPFTRMHPATGKLARRHAPGHVRVRIDPRDDGAYWRLLGEEWRRPGDLVLVEQDVGLRAGVLDGFAACARPWCGHPYLIGAQLLVCLGCTRFSAGLKAAEPDLLEVVGDCADGGVPARSWRRLDVRLADELRRRGYEPHEHAGAVKHYHRYPLSGGER